MSFKLLTGTKSQQHDNLSYEKSPHSEKSHKTVNLCQKKSQTSVKKSPKCTLM